MILSTFSKISGRKMMIVKVALLIIVSLIIVYYYLPESLGQYFEKQATSSLFPRQCQDFFMALS